MRNIQFSTSKNEIIFLTITLAEVVLAVVSLLVEIKLWPEILKKVNKKEKKNEPITIKATNRQKKTS